MPWVSKVYCRTELSLDQSSSLLVFCPADVNLLTGAELYQPNTYIVLLNGVILGVTRRAQKFVYDFRRLRRAGRISEFVTVFVNTHQRTVNLSSDGGRICRPLIIVEKGKPRVTQKHIDVTIGMHSKKRDL